MPVSFATRGRRRARPRAGVDELAQRRERLARAGASRGGGGADTSTTSPRGGCSRVVRGQLGGAPAADFLVQLRQLAADRDRALGVARGEQRERAPPGGAGTRTRRASRAAPRQQPLELGALARQEARRSASARPAARRRRARSATALGPGSTSTGERRPRGTRARARSRGRRSSGMPASETSATTVARRAIRATSSRARARSLCSWKLTSAARRSRGGRAAPCVWRVSSQATTSASRSAASTRSVTSSRLPIGVGHTTSRPTGAPRGGHPANIGCLPMAPDERRAAAVHALPRRPPAAAPRASERAASSRRVQHARRAPAAGRGAGARARAAG